MCVCVKPVYLQLVASRREKPSKVVAWQGNNSWTIKVARVKARKCIVKSFQNVNFENEI